MFFVLPYSSGAGGSSGLATGSVAAGGVASGAATGAATGAAAALVVLAEATVATAVQEQVAYWLAKLKQEQARTVRPEPDTLSDRGGKLPGRIRASSADGSDDDDKDDDDDDDDEVIYLVQQGIIRYGDAKGPICGRWTGQPMTTLPAWERGQGR